MPEQPRSPESHDLLDELDQALAHPGVDPLAALAGLLSQEGGCRGLESTALQGTRIAGYELVQLIGIGGMGATYRGLDREGGEVAVKIVGALSLAHRERFESECEILRKLDHPGVVRYRGHGVSDGGNGYLVMDYVDAPNLQDVLDEVAGGEDLGFVVGELLQGVDEESVYESQSFQRRMIRLVASVADVLASAHEAGVIHRDIKPANILVRSNLEPVLIDFGLGRDLFRNVSLTRTAAVMGTLSYMAPEQLRGDDAAVDARADVFSLGLVLYRCLTGVDLRSDASRVFRTSRAPILFDRSVTEHIPRLLQAILYRCLDPKPRKRYQEIGDLARDLRASLGSGAVRARYPGFVSRCSRTRKGRALLAIPLVAVAVLMVVLVTRPGHYLWVDALYDGGDLRIDDDPQIWKTPVRKLVIAPGRHVLHFEDGDSKLRKEFVVDRNYTRITVMNPRLDRMKIHESLYSGEVAAYVRVHGGAEQNQLWVDDRSVPPIARWIRLEPGVHTLRARGPGGLEEVQVLELLPSEVHLAHLLFDRLSGVQGSFRYSMSSVVSPHPVHVTLTMQDGAVPFINGFAEIEGEPDQIAMQSMITSMVPDKEVSATLRVRFPVRMRSLVFMQLSRSQEPGALAVEYRTEHVDWTAVPKVYTPAMDLVSVTIDPRGTRWFELRGCIKVRQEPTSWSTSKFLTAYLDRYGEKDHCCFAIVADPDPAKARAK